MACVVEGVGERRWDVPEWVARNAAFFLAPCLAERPAGDELARRLRAFVDERAPRVVLGDLLATPDVARGWREAVAAAEAVIAAEDPQAWNVPGAYEPFRRAFAELRALAGGEG